MELIWIGPTKPTSIFELVEDYRKRIQHWVPLKIKEIKPVKGIQVGTKLIIEEEKLLKKCLEGGEHYLILLDEKGKSFDSQQFAKWLDGHLSQTRGNLTFIIGGAFGFSAAMRKEAHEVISFSPMTLSHQLIRLVFMEQLYRGLSIIHHQPYHND